MNPPAVAIDASLDVFPRLLSTSPNVLLEGPETATDAIVRQLVAHCAGPVASWGRGLAGPRPRTLVVREASALTLAEQRRLLEWMATGERSQVVATSSQPLFALAARGQFLEPLYYRLNVVRFEVHTGTRLENLCS